MMKSPARFLFFLGALSCAGPTATGPVYSEQALVEAEAVAVVTPATRTTGSPSTVPIVFELTSPESLASWMERGWVQSHRTDHSTRGPDNRWSAFHAVEVDESPDAADWTPSQFIDGTLRVKDGFWSHRQSGPESWSQVSNAQGWAVEVKARLAPDVDGDQRGAAGIITINDGTHPHVLSFRSGFAMLAGRRVELGIDVHEAHTYRVEGRGDWLRLLIDGQMRMEIWRARSEIVHPNATLGFGASCAVPILDVFWIGYDLSPDLADVECRSCGDQLAELRRTIAPTSSPSRGPQVPASNDSCMAYHAVSILLGKTLTSTLRGRGTDATTFAEPILGLLPVQSASELRPVVRLLQRWRRETNERDRVQQRRAREMDRRRIEARRRRRKPGGLVPLVPMRQQMCPARLPNHTLELIEACESLVSGNVGATWEHLRAASFDSETYRELEGRAASCVLE